jgi:hypothetical protein
MQSKSFTLLFYLKKRNNYQGGKLPIYLRFTVDGQRIELTAKRDCEPEGWNSATGRMLLARLTFKESRFIMMADAEYF